MLTIRWKDEDPKTGKKIETDEPTSSLCDL